MKPTCSSSSSPAASQFRAGASNAHAIGELCVGGDWACAHGDFSGLRDVARKLAIYLPEPLHCDLVELADTCLHDPERASVLWDRLKNRVYRGDL